MFPRLYAIFTTGRVVYTIIRNTSDQVWNGSSFVAYNAANWTTYAVSLAEQGATGYYAATIPAGITVDGIYTVEHHDRSGGSPAVTDATVFTGEFGVNIGYPLVNASRHVSRVVTVDAVTGLTPSNLDAAVSSRLAPGGAVNVTQVNGANVPAGTGFPALDFTNRPLPYTIHNGTAQAGSATTITLASLTSSSVNSYYNGAWIVITSGVGAGQTRQIISYVGSTRVATVAPAWLANPTSASVYSILPVSAPLTDANGRPFAFVDGYTQRHLEPSLLVANIGSITNAGTRLNLTTGNAALNSLDASGANLAGLIGCIAVCFNADDPTTDSSLRTSRIVAASNGSNGAWIDVEVGASFITTAILRVYPAVASSSDPWSTALPGSYTAGMAGHIVGTRLDATITSRLAAGGVNVTQVNGANVTAGRAFPAVDASGVAASEVVRYGFDNAPWLLQALVSTVTGSGTVLNLDPLAYGTNTRLQSLIGSVAVQFEETDAANPRGTRTSRIVAASNGTGSFITVDAAAGFVAGVTVKVFAAVALRPLSEPSPERDNIADAVLTRNVSNVEATATEHTLATAILLMLESQAAGVTLTIRRTDGTTTHFTKTLTTNVAAVPVTGIT